MSLGRFCFGSLTFVSLLYSPFAEAAIVCPSMLDSKKPLTRCEDNFALANSAMDCVDRFDAAIRTTKAKLEKLLKARVKAVKETNQATVFNESDASYREVRDELKTLILDGAVAALATQFMLDNLFYPEDFDNPETTGVTPELYLKREPCFAAPKYAMQNSVLLIRKMQMDLKKLETAAGLNETSSETRAVQVQGVSETLPVAGTHGKGAETPKRKPKNTPSDITGVKEDKAKRQ